MRLFVPAIYTNTRQAQLVPAHQIQKQPCKFIFYLFSTPQTSSNQSFFTQYLSTESLQMPKFIAYIHFPLHRPQSLPAPLSLIPFKVEYPAISCTSNIYIQS